MELKIGKMSSRDLATWFDISYNTYRNAKAKYLEKLKPFARFQEVYGGVQIEEVYIPTYVKKLSGDVEVYLKCVKEANDNLTSITGMVEDLRQSNQWSDISEHTLRARLSRAGEVAFGTTKEEDSRGIYGSREYVWCIKLHDKPNHYRYLTVEEEKIFNDLIQTVYSSDVERIKKIMLLEETFKTSKMTKEEYFEKKDRMNLNCFAEVLGYFLEATGYQIVRATHHDIDPKYLDSAF